PFSASTRTSRTTTAAASATHSGSTSPKFSSGSRASCNYLVGEGSGDGSPPVLGSLTQPLQLGAKLTQPIGNRARRGLQFGSDLVPRIALAHAGHDLRQRRHVDDERWSGYLTED